MFTPSNRIQTSQPPEAHPDSIRGLPWLFWGAAYWPDTAHAREHKQPARQTLQTLRSAPQKPRAASRPQHLFTAGLYKGCNGSRCLWAMTRATLMTCLNCSRENSSGSWDSGLLEGDCTSLTDCQMADDLLAGSDSFPKGRRITQNSQMHTDCSAALTRQYFSLHW